MEESEKTQQKSNPRKQEKAQVENLVEDTIAIFQKWTTPIFWFWNANESHYNR